jgi:hypothetical protein
MEQRSSTIQFEGTPMFANGCTWRRARLDRARDSKTLVRISMKRNPAGEDGGTSAMVSGCLLGQQAAN